MKEQTLEEAWNDLVEAVKYWEFIDWLVKKITAFLAFFRVSATENDV